MKSPLNTHQTLLIVAILMVALILTVQFTLVYGMSFALFGLCIWLLFHLHQLQKLLDWLQKPTLDTLPEGKGSWEDIYTALHHQLRQQEKNQRKLHTTLDRFISAGEAMPDGVIVLNEFDRIDWCNVMAMHHFGIDRRHDIGQQITFLVRQPNFIAYMSQTQTGEPLILRQQRDGERILSIQQVPFDSTRKLLLSRDITQLEHIYTVHRDFVANVSHELRTPITVMNGFLEMQLEQPDNSPQKQHHLNLMFEQAQRMRDLVDDLLILSRLESQPQRDDELPINIPALMLRIEEEALSISQDQHQISFNITGATQLIGQHKEIYSAFTNLITNAIRYTASGGGIQINWKNTQDGGACFSVQDSGIGIPPEDLPRITERFYRVDRGRSRETGGTGLGLAIVKHIAIRHQAQLEIQSAVGKGSTFSLYFPHTRVQA